MNGSIERMIDDAARHGEPIGMTSAESVRQLALRHRRRRRLLIASAGFACAAVVVGAGVLARQGGSNLAASDAGNSPVISSEREWNVVPTAKVTGTLSDVDGCLVLDQIGVVLWPAGSRWDAESQTVRVPDSPPVELDVAFDGGGGFYANPSHTALADLAGSKAADMVQSCMEQTGLTTVVYAYP